MKFVFYSGTPSPHQMPLARRLAGRIGENEFRFVYDKRVGNSRRELGWSDDDLPKWCISRQSVPDVANVCDVLLTGVRNMSIFEQRAKDNKITFYQSERWFKPIAVGGLMFPGWLRLLNVRYFHMAWQFARLLESDTFKYFAIGPAARKDALLIAKLFGRKINNSQIVPWGYFVEPSELVDCANQNEKDVLKALYIGRFLRLKRIDTIIKAAAVASHHTRIHLDIVGQGPEELELRQLAEKCERDAGGCLKIEFCPAVKQNQVRSIMRKHHVLVFASNALDGWGAVVSEGLEEGMVVLGSRECGAPATLLIGEYLFHSGDTTRLAKLLEDVALKKLSSCGVGDWSVIHAVDRICAIVGGEQ